MPDWVAGVQWLQVVLSWNTRQLRCPTCCVSCVLNTPLYVPHRFTCCVTYYGVTFALGDSLGGNRYVNFALGVLVEVPSIFISVYLANK